MALTKKQIKKLRVQVNKQRAVFGRGPIGENKFPKIGRKIKSGVKTIKSKLGFVKRR